MQEETTAVQHHPVQQIFCSAGKQVVVTQQLHLFQTAHTKLKAAYDTVSTYLHSEINSLSVSNRCFEHYIVHISH